MPSEISTATGTSTWWWAASAPLAGVVQAGQRWGLLGHGNGTFQPAVNCGTGGDSGPFWPVSIAIGDVNGDQKPDLVAANGGSNTVAVLLGNGDGTFRPAVTYGSGVMFPVSVAVADVNGDGKADVVVANECADSNCDGSVGVLLGNGDGTLRAASTYSSGGRDPKSIAAVDVNGDAKPDLIVANDCAGGCSQAKGGSPCYWEMATALSGRRSAMTLVDFMQMGYRLPT